MKLINTRPKELDVDLDYCQVKLGLKDFTKPSTNEVTLYLDSVNKFTDYLLSIKSIESLVTFNSTQIPITVILDAKSNNLEEYLIWSISNVHKAIHVDNEILNSHRLQSYLDLINRQDIVIYKKSYKIDGSKIYPIYSKGIHISPDNKCPTAKINMNKVERNKWKELVKKAIRWLSQKGNREIGLDLGSIDVIIKKDKLNLDKFANALAKLVNLGYPFYWLDISLECAEYKLAQDLIDVYKVASTECKIRNIERAFNTSSLWLGKTNWETELLLYSAWQKMLDNTGYGHTVNYIWTKGRLTEKGLTEWLSSPIKSLFIKRG